MICSASWDAIEQGNCAVLADGVSGPAMILANGIFTLTGQVLAAADQHLISAVDGSLRFDSGTLYLSHFASLFQIEPARLLVDWAKEPTALAAAVLLLSVLIVIAFTRGRNRAIAPPAAVNFAVAELADVYQRYGNSDTGRIRTAAVARPTADPSETFPCGPVGRANHQSAAVAWLEVMDGSGQRFPIDVGVVRIGRHSDNDIVLSSETVHRHHAKLVGDGHGRFRLQDLGGVNGTRVNGARFKQVMLADGDLVELGELRARFISSGGSAL